MSLKLTVNCVPGNLFFLVINSEQAMSVSWSKQQALLKYCLTVCTGHNIISPISSSATSTLSRPLDVNYVLDQGQGHGHLSKYLISGLIFHFFHVYMKIKFKPFSKKKVS